jgi:thymidylate synthase (FAD)
VRHRLASYSQESTRYCNYAKNDAITVVDIREFIKTCIAKSNQPDKLHSMEAAIQVWEYAMETCEDAYMQLIKLGVTPEIARGVLPTNLKTELYITCNLREWYEIFSQRTNYNPSAHPQMRDIMDDLLLEFTTSIPVIFDALVLNTI